MVTSVFISDLHLSSTHPCLIQGFFALLKYYQQFKNQVRLYILGDWFNVWVGDDIHEEWIDEIIYYLKQFSQRHEIYFLAGNRDFALGQVFLDQFNAQLLKDGTILHIANKKIRIEHGDALCTDDISYQRFKKIIRNPFILNCLKRLPITIRKKIAYRFRQKSQIAHQYKTMQIMDVNQDAVLQATKQIDILIHGHTHRPAIHHLKTCDRIVLGDWREYSNHQYLKGEAMILEIDDQAQIQFKKWIF